MYIFGSIRDAEMKNSVEKSVVFLLPLYIIGLKIVPRVHALSWIYLFLYFVFLYFFLSFIILKRLDNFKSNANFIIRRPESAEWTSILS